MTLLRVVFLSVTLPVLAAVEVAAAEKPNPSRSNAQEARPAADAAAIPQPPEDPVERAYQALLQQDDAAQEEVEKMLAENQAFEAKGAGLAQATLHARIDERLRPVRKAYEDFLRNYPNHARARLAFGSFLNDSGEEAEARNQWEKARELDPANPAAWNNLANSYGHRGPVKKAFEYYAKAIELNPNEPIYYQNFATTVFLFRTDAREHFNLTEQQVFDKALHLYQKALELAPNDFLLAEDVAQTFYGIKPERIDDALAAWEKALKLAADDVQQQGVYLHMARVNSMGGRFAKAKELLAKVNLPGLADLKRRVTRGVDEREIKAKIMEDIP